MTKLKNIEKPPIHPITKIAVTGGPSGGKTTLIDTVKRDMHKNLAVVPEAASILFKGGFPRKLTTESKIYSQRAIYFIQKELEELVGHESKKHILVCDRGALDGVAYWPYSEANFFENLGIHRTQELSRYQWVMHLDTAPADQYDESNPVRLESFSEATAINSKIKEAWRDHPQRIIIGENQDFFQKITLAIGVIKAIFEGKTYQEVVEQLVKDSP